MMYEEMMELEEMLDVVEDYIHETDRILARRHRNGDIREKLHLADIYPISTDSIRKNGNGAYIRKGNQIRYQYEQISSRKNRREEGKREIRRYIPESYEDTTPSYRDVLQLELSALILEADIISSELRAMTESDCPDWITVGFLTDDLSAVGNRIREVRTVLDNEDGVWSF